MRALVRILCGLSLLLGGCAAAERPLPTDVLPISDTLVLEMALPSDRWKLAEKAPQFLVEEIAEHIEHDMVERGIKFPAGEPVRQADKRLAGNEAYLYNPESGAWLTIDFSALREGEGSPSARSVANSARHAGNSLESDHGVTEARLDVGKMRLEGARATYRIDAAYLLHGESRKFVGSVGFAEPYWFFLYYTDPLRDPRDFGEMEAIFDSFALRQKQ